MKKKKGYTSGVEKGIITSTRSVIDIGRSKAITLDKRWLMIQKWLGKEVSELVSLANNVVVLVPPEKAELAHEVLRRIEEEFEKQRIDKEEKKE